MAITNIIKFITLDVYDHDKTPKTIKSITADNDTRGIAAELQYEGVRYDMGQSATVELIILRPDNVGVGITGSPYEFSYEGPGQYNPETGERIPGETITYYGAYAELDQAALAQTGTLFGQFKITSGEQILRTEIFKVNNGRALDTETSEWEGEYQGYNLDELVETVNEVSEAAQGVIHMTVTSQTLPQGASASVTKTEDEDGIINLDFGLPLASGEVQVVTVTGSNPTITAEYNKRYICGEVSTLTITPAQQGCTDVLFTSGTTPTVLSLPNAVKMPSWFTVEANKTYEINILDGVYGSVMSWT